MRKLVSFGVAAAIIACTSPSHFARAQGQRSREDRVAITVGRIAAVDEMHAARIKADLHLTANQERNWPEFESAFREIRSAQDERQVTRRADPGRRGDLIGYLTDRATILADRSAEIRKLAEAAQPLYASFDDQQKKRFDDDLIRLDLR